jgi:hypothetical protein
MIRTLAVVLTVTMIGAGAAAQPVRFTASLHPPAQAMVARRTLVHTAITPAGADQARGLLIAALLISAARSR